MELRIKDTAKRKGYTLAKLAKKINIDTTTLSRYNTGKVEAPLHKLKIIANALSVEVIELIPVEDPFLHVVINGEWIGVMKNSKPL